MTTLLKNAWIYTPQGVIEGGYVVIDEAAIVSVGAERPEGRFDCEKDMSGKLLLPGLVNAHTHAAMTRCGAWGLTCRCKGGCLTAYSPWRAA